MPYKSKAKQQEAVKRAVKKHRKGITSEGITDQGITLVAGGSTVWDEPRDQGLYLGQVV